MFNKKLFKDIKDRQQLRRKDNEMKNRQMKEMEENIRTLNEELEATKALLNGEEEKDNKLLAIDSKVKAELGLDQTFDLDATSQTILDFQ